MPFTIYDSDKLNGAARSGAIEAAEAVFEQAGVTAVEAMGAQSAALLLADELDGQDPTEEDFAVYGRSLAGFHAYHEAREAAETAIARLDPAHAGFKVMFTVAS